MKKIIVMSLLTTLFLASCSWGAGQGNKADEIVQTNANYMAYNNQDLSMSDDAQVLFFHAKWCPDCVTANKNIAEAKTTSDVKIYKIDYDNSDELKKKYEVTKQHTFVQVDSQGNMIKKWTGTTTLDKILGQVEMPNKNDSQQEENIDIDNAQDELSNIETQVLEESKNGKNKRNNYVEYSEDMLKDGESKVLFFHAKWCPSCKAADEKLSEVDNTIGIDVVKVDYDSYTDLKEKYGIVSQHTFVFVDGEGNLMKRWYGSRSYDDILEELQS